MIINKASLDAIQKGSKTIFNEAFAGVKPEFERFAMVVPSETREETYAWMGAMPKLRKWVGERHIKNLSTHSYAIKNEKWELTIAVEADDIKDDKIGVYSPLFAEMGRSAAIHPDELLFSLFALGFTTACYDGQYFFDTDHPVGTGVVSNYGGGAGTAWYLLDVSRVIKPFVYQKREEIGFVAKDSPEDDTVFMKDKYIYGCSGRDNAGFGLWQLAYASKLTLDAANYASSRAAMMNFKDDEGKPLGVLPSLLVVPPSLESAARSLLLKEKDAAGADNPWFKTAELIVSPWL